jgi:putative DNA primase/helicase
MAGDKDKTRGLNLRDIPGLAAMLKEERWIDWWRQPIKRKDGNPGFRKVPRIPGTLENARSNDLTGARGYDVARAAAVADKGLAGVGWMMLDDLGRAAIDIDHCRDPVTGKIDGWALALLTNAPGAYREVTPSGTGLRIIGTIKAAPGTALDAFQGNLQVKSWVEGLKGSGGEEERAWWGVGIKARAQVELFHACARFITVTGWDGIGDCETDITTLVEWLMERAEKGRTTKAIAPPPAMLLGEIEDVIACLAEIPNPDNPDWNRFAVRIGMAVWGATGGSAEGFDAWVAWSARAESQHDESVCIERWGHWGASTPPGSGIWTLIRRVRETVPGWLPPTWRPERVFEVVEGPEGNGGDPPPGELESPVGETIPAGGKKKKPAATGSVVTEGNTADAFTALHAEHLRFDHTRGKWSLWDGTRWKREETKLAYRWAHAEARRLARGKGSTVAVRAGKAAFAAGVERLAQAGEAFAVTHEIWDRDPWLLGTPDGVIDLRTGKTREARPEDYITRLTAVAPAASEDCPLWMAFLSEATGNDQGMIGFLQRWFGYCLTGITQEHALVFIHGDGGNGKGVAMNTIFGIMGGYATNAAMDTFVVTRGDKHTTDLAMLDGARMVMASEVEEGQTWAEARIKAITGGDPITARFMRQDNFTFIPRFKLTISGNHKPALKGVDNSTRRRFNIVPFNKRPEKPDPELSEKLKAEWPGILRWMINGCLEWRRIGLGAPAVVAEATADYFEAQDYFGRWLEDRCNLGWGLKDTPIALLRSFEDWCRENREEMTDSRRLRGMLEKMKGVEYARNREGRFVTGIELKDTKAVRDRKAAEEAEKAAAAEGGGSPRPEEEAPGEF